MNRTFFYLLLAGVGSAHLHFLAWQLRLPHTENLTPARAWVETEVFRQELPYRKQRLGNALTLWVSVAAAIGVYEASRIVARRKQIAERAISSARDTSAAGGPPPPAPRRDDVSERFRERAAGIRRRTSLALVLADAVPGDEACPTSQSPRRVPLRFSACELLGRMLERQAHGDEEGENVYLTAHDFEQLRHLAVRVERLRHEAGRHDATARVAGMLHDEAVVCAECAEEMGRAIDAFTAGEDAFREALRDAAGRLQGEIALLDHHAAAGGDHPGLVDRIDRYLGAAVRGTDARSRAAGRSSSDRETVSPASRDPDLDAARIDACVRHAASALAAFEGRAEEAAAACVRGAEAAIPRVCAGGLVRPRRASGSATAPEPHGSSPELPSAVLLEYGRQPALASFDCCADLAVLLAVADEAAAGGGPADMGPMVETCRRFREALRNADERITRALSMPTHGAERVAAARGILQALQAGLDAARVREAATALPPGIGRAKAKDTLKTAEQMARIGEIDLAARLAREAVRASQGAIDSRGVDENLSDVRSWLEVAERKFAHVRQEHARLAMWRQGFLNKEAAPASAEALRASLDDFFTHRSTLRIAPGGRLSLVLDDWSRECEPWCRLVGFEPPPCGWATMTAAIRASRPEAVEPARAFVDALCAMSSAQGGIAGGEAATIGAAVTRSGISAAPSLASVAVADWRRTAAERGRAAAIAQAVVNVDAIHEHGLLERLLRELRAVARADGELGEAEITVYHAFLIRIVPRLHGAGKGPAC